MTCAIQTLYQLTGVRLNNYWNYPPSLEELVYRYLTEHNIILTVVLTEAEDATVKEVFDLDRLLEKLKNYRIAFLGVNQDGQLHMTLNRYEEKFHAHGIVIFTGKIEHDPVLQKIQSIQGL